MLPDLKRKLFQYAAAFNVTDEELYPQVIVTKHAASFLADQTPLPDCPDKE